MCGHMEWRCGKLALWVNTFIAVLAARFNIRLFVAQVIHGHKITMIADAHMCV